MNEEDDLEAKEDDAGEAHEESKLGKLFDKAKGKAAEGLEAAKSGVRKGASAGKALAQRGAKATKGFVESGAVKAKVEKTKAVTKKLAKATGEGTKLAAGKVKEASAKAFEKTAEGASAAAKATKHFAGKVAEKTVEGGTTAFEKVRETAESVGEFTKEKLEGAKEALGGRKAGFAEPQSSEPQSSEGGARSAGEPEFLGRLGEARQSAKAQREAPEPREGDARTEAPTDLEPNQKAGKAGTAKNGRAEPREAQAQNSESEARSAGEPEFLGRLGEARQSAKAQREAPEPKEGKARTEAQTAWEPNQKAGEAGTAKNGRAEAQKAEARKAEGEAQEPSWSGTAEATLRVKRRPLAEDFSFLKAGLAEPQEAEPQSSEGGARSAGEPEFLGRLGEARQSAKAQREAPEPKEGKARTEAPTDLEPNQKAGKAGTAKNGRAEAQKAEAEPKEAEPQSSEGVARSAGEPEFLGRLGEARQSAKAQREAPEPREGDARTDLDPNQKSGGAGTAKNGRAEAQKAEARKAEGEAQEPSWSGTAEATLRVKRRPLAEDFSFLKAGLAEPQEAEPQSSEGGARSAGEPEFLGRLGEARQSAKAQREAPEPKEGKARTEAPTDLEPNQKAGKAGTAKNGRAEAQKAEAEPKEAEPQSSEGVARSAGEPEFLGRLGEARQSAKAQREAPEPREGDARTEAPTDLEPNQKAGKAGTAKNGRAEAQKAEAEPKEAEPQSSEGVARSAGEPEFLGRLGEARQSAKAQREAPEPREGNARTEAQTAWEPNQKAGEAGTAKNGRAEAQKAEAQKAKPEEAGKTETMAEELDQTAGAYAAKTKGKKFLLAVACAGALAGGGLTYSVVGPRYTIAEEFALTYNCIFNQKQKISKWDYKKLAECCAEVVEELEEKFPSLESIADKKSEVGSQIQESCRND